MVLKEFQKDAVRELLKAAENRSLEVVLKSPTGSGKTLILERFMSLYTGLHPDTAFVWLTPGKGSLEEQSRQKMRQYVEGCVTKNLAELMNEGFYPGQFYFINWEKLTKRGNQAMKEGEWKNFPEIADKAREDGISILVIIDESHQNNTSNADAILRYLQPKCVIRCSATPKHTKKTNVIEIPEETVIESGLIRKMLLINEDFTEQILGGSHTEYLLEKAIQKQRELQAAYERTGESITPLIIVQLPSQSQVLQFEVVHYFENQGIDFESGKLSIWMADQKENLNGITDLNGIQQAVLIKQAISTGWDCPRAQILVKLRDNMDETFEIQTIGRIRRMPRGHHYDNDLLDSCYLYTLDEKFTQQVKTHLGKNAADAARLFLKHEYEGISLNCEKFAAVVETMSPKTALKAMEHYYIKHYGLSSDKEENRVILACAGYDFNPDIVRTTLSGKAQVLEEISEGTMETIQFTEKLDTHLHGREYHNKTARIGMEIHLEYQSMNAIFHRLFDGSVSGNRKLLCLGHRQIYSFVINNAALLLHDLKTALRTEMEQLVLPMQQVRKEIWHFPKTCIFTYDGKEEMQKEYRKNVYYGYCSSAFPRTEEEKQLESFLESSEKIQWFYQNHWSGADAFSISYLKEDGSQGLYHPSYLVGSKGRILILDLLAKDDPNAFGKRAALQRYLEKEEMQGGFKIEEIKQLVEA